MKTLERSNLFARKSAIVVLVVLAAALGWVAASAEEPAPEPAKPAPEAAAKPADDVKPPEGFVDLLHGKDLAGWKGLGHFDPKKYKELSKEDREKLDAENDAEFKKHWRVENGELVNDGEGPYATTVKDYGDFELWIEYKTVAKADSGIYLRGTPQVQIWDTTKEGGKWDLGADKGSGALWNNEGKGKWPLVHADRPFGQWNSLKIKIVGPNVTVIFNDKLVVEDAPLENFWDRSKPVYETGPIQLQTHGGEIRWRNIFLREIPRK